ncbi:hypothetical protein M2419_002943 [Sphingobacterium sp. BIGb0116]|nr:hypothetical protein [Sphingobacterium sp. BIGb0116]
MTEKFSSAREAKIACIFYARSNEKMTWEQHHISDELAKTDFHHSSSEAIGLLPMSYIALPQPCKQGGSTLKSAKKVDSTCAQTTCRRSLVIRW